MNTNKRFKDPGFQTMKKGFTEAGRPRGEPTPGPGQKLHEVREFPMPRDPYLERRFMEKRLSGWVPEIAGIFGVNPGAIAIVTPTWTVVGADLPALLWVMLGDFVVRHANQLPTWVIVKTSPVLGKISDFLKSRGHIYTVIRDWPEGN
jgi:hypothetical protein